MNPRIRVYAWEFPVRFTHWINFLSIVTFLVTGIYIGTPYMHANRPEQFIMSYMRAAHFLAGYAFLCSFVLRIYWAFVGNKYASWRAWFPFSPERVKDLLDAVKFYTFMSRKPPYAVGHTALAGPTYLVLFLIFAFQIVSGFALHSLSSKAVLPALVGGWLLGVMELQTIRLYHHIGMYLIVAFVFIHMYIAWWLDTAERNGVMGSIFGGYKFVTGKEWE